MSQNDVPGLRGLMLTIPCNVYFFGFFFTGNNSPPPLSPLHTPVPEKIQKTKMYIIT